MTLISAHKTAILAVLNGDTVLGTCGHEGVVFPDPTTKQYPKRYWTFFTNSGARGTDRLGGIPGQIATLRYTFHWVASTPEQAQRLADRGVPLLAGRQLAVPGWAPFRIAHVSSALTQMDDTVKPPLHFIADQFELVTQPA